MDLRNRQERAHEDISIVRNEMKNVLQHLESKYLKYVELINAGTLAEKGILLTLANAAESVRKGYIRANNIFGRFIDTPPMPQCLVKVTDTDIHVSDTDLAEQIEILDIQEGDNEVDDDDESAEMEQEI